MQNFRRGAAGSRVHRSEPNFYRIFFGSERTEYAPGREDTMTFRKLRHPNDEESVRGHIQQGMRWGNPVLGALQFSFPFTHPQKILSKKEAHDEDSVRGHIQQGMRWGNPVLGALQFSFPSTTRKKFQECVFKI